MLSRAAETPSIGVRLEDDFRDLEVLGDSARHAIWSGLSKERDCRVAIHIVTGESISGRESRLARCRELQSKGWSFLPTILAQFLHHDQSVVVEEWVEGVSWSDLALSGDRSRELAAELFDILDTLHLAGIRCGDITASRVIFSPETCRLRLLGLVSREESPGDSSARERASALNLVSHLLSAEERTEAASCRTSSQISRLLRGASRARTDGEPPFVGREAAIQELHTALALGHVITVEAPSGAGKTRLLREWSRTAGVRVLWAKADREVAPSPFQMFTGPIAQLEEELSKRPDLASLLVHELGVELPLMNGLQGRGETSTRLQRGTLVMLGLMLAVFGKDRPTVLVLDDCHWADPLTLRFLEYWAVNGEALLVVATFRGDEVGPLHPLRQLKCSTIRLPPLTSDQARQLLLSREPGASPTLRDSAIEKADGNPFLLLSYLRGGPLEEDSDKRLLAGLSVRTQRALETASVLGREFSRSVLDGCLGEEADLDEAYRNGLLETTAAGGVRFVHDRIRDTVMARLHADELSDRHLRTARFLQTRADSQSFEIAFHFQAAGYPAEGLPHALTSARSAREKHDLSTAAFYLQIAITGAEGVGDLVLKGVLLGQLGDCYRLVGLYSEGLDCLVRALPLAENDVVRAKLKETIGDVHFKQGDLELARGALVEGLRMLGERLPRFIPLAFLKEAIVQAAHTYFPSYFMARRPMPTEGDALLRADLYNRLAYVTWFLEGPVPSIWAHLRELNLAEQYPPTRTLARARATHAIAMSAFPLWSRALRFGEQAVETARLMGDDWGEGQAAHFYGATLLGASKLKEARRVLEASIKKLKGTGDRWEENGALYHLGIVYYRLGALERAASLAQQTQKVGVDISDRLAAGDNLFTWARATGGAMPVDSLNVEKTFTTPDIQRAAELLGAEAMLALRGGRFDEAATLVEQAIAIYEARRAQSLYSASLPCWLTTARRLAAQTAPELGRAQLLKMAKRALRGALSMAKKYRNNLPHALREKALLLAIEGRFSDARRCLSDSTSLAQELSLGQELEINSVLTERWAWLVGGATSRPSSTPSRRPAEYDWLIVGSDKGRPQPTAVSLVRLLEATNQLVGCRSADTTYHQLCRACKTLVGAQTATVLWVEAGRVGERLGGDPSACPPDISRASESCFVLRPLHTGEGGAHLWVVRQGRPFAPEDTAVIDYLALLATTAIARAPHPGGPIGEAALAFSAATEELALNRSVSVAMDHDLRNLLTGLMGHAELLKLDSDPQGEVWETGEAILVTTQKAAQLLHHFSSLVAGHTQMVETFDPVARLRENCSMLASLCAGRAELVFEPGSTNQVRLDPMTFDRLILNLVLNARDSLGANGRVVVETLDSSLVSAQVGFPDTLPAGRYLSVTVADNGSGIPAEILPRVFDLNFTTKGERGTGVGLATVRELMRANEGFLTVQTTLGAGSRFTLTFPAG